MTGLSDETIGKKPPRVRLTADQRMMTILLAARREFARVGFHGASTASIAAVAGCSEPMLYKHFPSKQALFAAVLDDVGRTMEAQIDSILLRRGDPIENWISSLPDTMSNPVYAEMVGLRKLAVTVAVSMPDVAASLREGTERLVSRTRTAIVRSQELGSIRPDVDPDYVAWMWMGITLVGTYRSAIDGPGGFESLLPTAQLFLNDIRVTT